LCQYNPSAKSKEQICLGSQAATFVCKRCWQRHGVPTAAYASHALARYAVTSYAAQGKTGDYVIFSDSAIRAATNQKQWYVTISRGRKGIHIFTTDKQQLRENINRSGNRELAIELAESQSQFKHQSSLAQKLSSFHQRPH
jgi:hypothetical protein